MPLQKIKNITFSYQLIGDNSKPPLVLISGYTSDHKAWENLVKSLKDDFYILVFDNQGIGETQDEGSPLSIEMMAKNSKELIDALGFENPVIVGFAMGSTIAQVIAKEYPNDISQLILISSLIKWSEKAKSLCENLCKLREQQKFSEYAGIIYDTCFSDDFKKTNKKEDFVANLAPVLKNSQTASGQRRQVEALKAFDSTSWIKQVKVPTLVISPEFDIFTTKEEGEALAKAVQNGRQIIIKGSGHAVLDEALDQLVKEIEKNVVKPLESKFI